VVVAHADHEFARAPGELDHRVAACAGELAPLGGGVHDLEAVEASDDQRVEPSPVVALVFRERGDRERFVGGVRVREKLQQARPIPAIRTLDGFDATTQQDDVRPPRAHLASAAERHRDIHRNQAGGRVVVGDEHGVEAGALVPLEIALRIVARDRRPADVVRGAGVSVEVHRGEVGALALQSQHRAVGQEPAADEQREQHHDAHQRAKLLAEHDSLAHDGPPDAPDDEQEAQAEEEAVEPAEAQHGRAVPERVHRREHDVRWWRLEVYPRRNREAGGIGERRRPGDPRRQEPQRQPERGKEARPRRARDSPGPPSTRRGARG